MTVQERTRDATPRRLPGRRRQEMVQRSDRDIRVIFDEMLGDRSYFLDVTNPCESKSLLFLAGAAAVFLEDSETPDLFETLTAVFLSQFTPRASNYAAMQSLCSQSINPALAQQFPQGKESGPKEPKNPIEFQRNHGGPTPTAQTENHQRNQNPLCRRND